ncbi:MAG: hypothetical protein IKX06_05405 [Clostridia bacterium]|nr:hypothetical protein [Clostridia bacterium]
MKKVLALMIAAVMVFALLSVSAFADDGHYVWNHSGEFVNDPWTETFCLGNGKPTTGHITFETDVSFSKVVFPMVWAEKGCTVTLKIFPRKSTEAVFSGDQIMVSPSGSSGDVPNLEFDIGKALPAGKYTFEFTLSGGSYALFASGKGPLPESYIVNENGHAMFGLWTTDSGTGFVEISDEKVVSIYSGATGDVTPHDLLEGGRIGVIVTVPKGYALAEAIGVLSPTWENKEGGSDAKAELFKWTGDYDESVAGDVLASGEVKGHEDNTNAVFVFDKQYTEGTYLLVFTATGAHKLGFWADSQIDGEAEVFQNDAEVDWYPRVQIKVVLDEGQGVSVQVPDDQPGEQQGDQPGDTTPQEPNTGTGDSSVVVFAVTAVLALCATVVLKKKRVF